MHAIGTGDQSPVASIRSKNPGSSKGRWLTPRANLVMLSPISQQRSVKSERSVGGAKALASRCSPIIATRGEGAERRAFSGAMVVIGLRLCIASFLPGIGVSPS